MLEAIGADCRIDSRTRLESRILHALDQGTYAQNIKFGHENGQAMVQLGHTKVITQSNLKVICPRSNKPNEGEFRFNVEFTSLMHSAEGA